MKFLTTSSFEVDVYCIEIMVIHEHLYKYFFDDAKCLSAIWLCNVQSLDDVCLEAVIFLDSYNIEKLSRSLSIKSTDVTIFVRF